MSIRSPVSPSLSPPPPPALSPSPASGVTADDHCCCTPDPCGATASPHSKLLFLWNGHHSLGFHRADKRRTPEDTNFRPDRQRGIARRLSSLAMHMTCSTLCLVPTGAYSVLHSHASSWTKENGVARYHELNLAGKAGQRLREGDGGQEECAKPVSVEAACRGGSTSTRAAPRRPAAGSTASPCSPPTTPPAPSPSSTS
ncbi:uncharacterized protein LOC104585532 isoform X2 [Brachypodium distachyon]|uniref:uncharacterized protein LOC104585532 isoform X2 n=1 Tax=Brachypodium distachyon TaxID=15368 RepID=UPI000D0DB411|nr:uncharacterized protein LOC104585532 isoform X2 [Brachypodium distachyon]|eukprot:XP_024311881.1 uncharacterized protein LOC104585532 isoform X2 [Brachypodium distachyon]